MRTSRTLRILNKRREYLFQKPEKDLVSESAQEHMAIYLNNQARFPATIRRRKHVNPHVEGTMLKRMKIARNCFQEKKQAESMAEGAPSKPNEPSSNQTLVLGERVSQISENSYKTALASTSSAEPNDVANTVEDYDNIENNLQEYVKANLSGKLRFKSKYLKKIHIVVSGGKYKKKKCCTYCHLEGIKDR